jgi:hypothetical protein
VENLNPFTFDKSSSGELDFVGGKRPRLPLDNNARGFSTLPQLWVDARYFASARTNRTGIEVLCRTWLIVLP